MARVITGAAVSDWWSSSCSYYFCSGSYELASSELQIISTVTPACQPANPCCRPYHLRLLFLEQLCTVGGRWALFQALIDLFCALPIVMKARAGPDGVHIFNRVTGANLLINEVTVPVENWSPAPRQVSIALTNACDLKCPHCYAPKHSAKLGLDRLARWLKELDKNGCFWPGLCRRSCGQRGDRRRVLRRRLRTLMMVARTLTVVADTFSGERLSTALATASYDACESAIDLHS